MEEEEHLLIVKDQNNIQKDLGNNNSHANSIQSEYHSPRNSVKLQEWTLYTKYLKNSSQSLESTINQTIQNKKIPALIESDSAPEPYQTFVANYLALDQDKIIEQKVGSSGKHLHILLFQSCLSVFSAALFTYFISYSTVQPIFYCKFGDNPMKFTCSEEEYCNNSLYEKVSIDKQFNSWFWKQKQYCNIEEREFIKSGCILIAAIFTGLAYLTSDRISRTLNVFLWTLLSIICGFLAYFVTDLYTKFFLQGVMLALPSQTAGSYGHIINESTTSYSNIRKRAIGCYLIFYAIAGVVLSIVFFYIENSDDGIIFVSFVNILPLLTTYLTTFDGPKYWFRRGKINNTLKSLARICDRNGKTQHQIVNEIFSKKSDDSDDELNNKQIEAGYEYTGKLASPAIDSR